MYKLIVFFCIFVNFWGVFIMMKLGWVDSDAYIAQPNYYYHETITELAFVSSILLFYAFFSFNVKRYLVELEVVLKNKKIIYFIFFVLLVISLLSINFGLDNSTRGQGQFELENRGGMAGFLSNIGLFIVPFAIFIMLTKPFGKHNSMMLSSLLLVTIMSNITSGGRRNIVYVLIFLLLYFYYFRAISLKKVFYYSLPIILLFPVTIAMRNEDALMMLADADFIPLLGSSILGTNSDPSFIWQVKDYISKGIDLSPITFMGHFYSIFMPSFLLVSIFNQLSYKRATFIFDSLFNSNPNQGYDFMVLADFYWSFGYLGYILYIALIVWCLYFFKTKIYSHKLYDIIGAFLVVIFICQQRNDFGAVLKPFIYSYIFSFVLVKLCVAKFKISIKDHA